MQDAGKYYPSQEELQLRSEALYEEAMRRHRRNVLVAAGLALGTILGVVYSFGLL
jgi:hypothetical protein